MDKTCSMKSDLFDTNPELPSFLKFTFYFQFIDGAKFSK